MLRGGQGGGGNRLEVPEVRCNQPTMAVNFSKCSYAAEFHIIFAWAGRSQMSASLQGFHVTRRTHRLSDLLASPWTLE